MYSSRHYPKDVISTLSELKEGFMTDTIRELAAENIDTSKELSEKLTDVLADVHTFPRTFKTAEPLYLKIENIITSASSSLAGVAARS